MPLYRSISRVSVGNGRCTAFWLDAWLPGGALCSLLPALFSHALNVDATVAEVLSVDIRRALVPRLSSVGETQLGTLSSLLAGTLLSGGEDERTLTRCRKKNGGLDAGALYRLRSFGGVLSSAHDFVWLNYAPSKVRFFAWLLSKARIQARSSLRRKHILSAAEALCPICGLTEETANHLVFGCAFAAVFWRALGFSFPADADVKKIFSYAAPDAVPAETSTTFTLLCCWHLWKHRNSVAFQGQQPCLPLLIKNCADDALLWKTRLPAARRDDAESWLLVLAQARN
jgi:hypothetical protein